MLMTETAMSLPDTAMSLPETAMSLPETAMLLPETAMSLPEIAMSLPDIQTMIVSNLHTPLILHEFRNCPISCIWGGHATCLRSCSFSAV